MRIRSEAEQRTKIMRFMQRQRTMSDATNLEINTVVNRYPMQRFKNRSDV